MAGKRPFRLGLTGGIASGKSTVSAMLQQLGAVVIDADLLAREQVQTGSAALEKIHQHFGPAVLAPDGSLRREALGQLVFADPAEKCWLEELLHPLIKARAEELAFAAAQASQPVVVFDVPLLFESGWDQLVDAVWTVYVPLGIQRERLKLRDGLTDAEMDARLAAQWPIERKTSQSAVVIDNQGPLKDTWMQVGKAWNELLGDQKRDSATVPGG